MDVPAAKRPVTENARYAVTLTAALGLAATLLITSAGFAPAYQNRALHVAKETAGALVLLLVAALLIGRFTRRGTLQDLLALAGVLVVATKNLVFSVITAILSEISGGPTTWRTTGAGMLGAGLLAAAALSAPRLVRNRKRALMVTAGASVLGFARRAEREADEFQMWLGVGCTIAGIGYMNYALFPSSYTDFLYAGDLFRVAAVVAFGIGTIREISRYQAVYAPAAVLDA